MKELDRDKPYAAVQGDSVARYYQEGKYFNASGKLISDEEAGRPGEGGSFTNQVESRVQEELAKQNADQELTLIDETNPRTNRKEDIAAAQKRAAERRKAASDQAVKTEPAEPAAPAESAERAERRAQLEGLHFNKIRKLVQKAGLNPLTGTDSKAKNIQLLLDNTE